MRKPSFKNLKKGELYEIRFWDHCLSSKAELVECTTIGYYHSQDTVRISFEYWQTHHIDFDNNREVTNLVKSAIISCKKAKISV